MKKIGIIGGLSWVTTAEYYRLINEMTQQMLGWVSSAKLCIESINRQDYVDTVITRQDENAACKIILKAAQSLEKAGADFLVISCNDVHRFVADIQPQISIPFLHIAHVTAQEIQSRGLSNVALMGVKKTMEGQFYPDILNEYEINVLIPTEDERDYIHQSIYDELVHNKFLDKTAHSYQQLIENFKQRGAQGVILGCTEIPLLLEGRQLAIPSFSTTQLHCKAAVEVANQET